MAMNMNMNNLETPQALLDWIRTLELNNWMKEHICQIVELQRLRFSDFSDFADADEMAQGLEMESVTAQYFWVRICSASKGKPVAKDDPPAYEPPKPALKETKQDDIVMVPAGQPDEAKSDSNESACNDSDGNGGEGDDNNNENEKKQVAQETLTKLHIGGTTGLHNLGNTCFLNSALQCLLHTPGFMDELIGTIESMRNGRNTAAAANNQNNHTSGTLMEQRSSIPPMNWQYNLKKGDLVLFRQSRNGFPAKCKVTMAYTDNSISIQRCKGKNRFQKIGPMFRADRRLEYYDATQQTGQHGSKQQQKAATDNKSTLGQWYDSARSTAWSYWTNPNGYPQNEQWKAKGNSMYGEGLSLVNAVHVERMQVFCPSQLHELIKRRVPELGNYQQHDSWQALMSLLKEIECDLPNKSKTELIFEYQVQDSIFDKPYDDATDVTIAEMAKEGGSLDVDANLVSKYFDGIQVTQNTCMNCGQHVRLFAVSRGLELPVVQSFCEITMFTFDENSGMYAPLMQNKIVPLDCSIRLAKFYALQSSEYGVCRVLESDVSIAAVGTRLDHCQVVSDNGYVSKLSNSKNVGLFAVKNFYVLQNKSDANLSKLNKVLCLQVVPDALSGTKWCPTSVFINCMLFSKDDIAKGRVSCEQLVQFLRQKQLGLFKHYGNCNSKLKSYKLCLYVNGQYVPTSKKDGQLPLPLGDNRSDNVIVCAWQKKDANGVNSGRAFETKLDSNDETVCSMRGEIKVEMIGKSLKSKLAYLQNVRSNLEATKQKLGINVGNFSLSTAMEDYEISQKLCRDADTRIASKNVAKKMAVCDEFIGYIEMMIDRESSVLSNVENGLTSLIKQCKLKNKWCVGVANNQKLNDIESCIKFYQSESFRTSQEYPTDCKNCGKAPILSISKSMVQGPQILWIKFNRGMNDSYSKHGHLVQYSMDLAFAGSNYRLFGVNIHSGSSGGGHYTSYVNRLGTDDWYYCNDRDVSPASQKTICRKSAQFLVYKRID